MSLTTSFPGKLLISGLLSLGAGAALANENYAVTGNAYNVKNDLLVYTEYYTDMNHNREVTVNYAKPDGSVFATKTLFYTGEVTQPEFQFHDKRDDEKISARFVDGRLILSHSLNYSTNERTILDNASLVIDVGYDAFIQSNWEKLTSGKKVNFMYALPAQVDTGRLQVREIARDKAPLATVNDPANWRYFVISPANRFSSIFSAPIYLAYSPDKYLMRYQGRSSIDNDKGGSWDVRIEYQYR